MPTSVLKTLIKLRHMSGEEIREYFQKRADFHSKYPNNPKSKFTAKEWARSREVARIKKRKNLFKTF